MSSIYTESAGGGYRVTMQYCEAPGCDKFLGVNYPRCFCPAHDA